MTKPSLDRIIINILRDHYDTYPGDPEISLTELHNKISEEEDSISNAKVLDELNRLKEKGWVEFDSLSQGDAGLT